MRDTIKAKYGYHVIPVRNITTVKGNQFIYWRDDEPTRTT